MAQSRAESTWDIYNYGKYINQFPPNMIKAIRQYERINKKICRPKMSIIIDEICINEDMHTKYTHTHTHTHTHKHIYIYIYISYCINLDASIPNRRKSGLETVKKRQNNWLISVKGILYRSVWQLHLWYVYICICVIVFFLRFLFYSFLFTFRENTCKLCCFGRDGWVRVCLCFVPQCNMVSGKTQHARHKAKTDTPWAPGTRPSRLSASAVLAVYPGSLV